MSLYIKKISYIAVIVDAISNKLYALINPENGPCHRTRRDAKPTFSFPEFREVLGTIPTSLEGNIGSLDPACY